MRLQRVHAHERLGLLLLDVQRIHAVPNCDGHRVMLRLLLLLHRRMGGRLMVLNLDLLHVRMW